MFSAQLQTSDIDQLVSQSLLTTTTDVKQCLQQALFKPHDLVTLLSPAAEPFLEHMAQRSVALTRQRFGNIMQLFIPMYLSNECFNTCTYCGFSMSHDYPRKTLTDSEIVEQAKVIAKKGFKHLLILTGESPKKVGVDYIENAIKLIKPFFSSIGIEIQPLNLANYSKLIQAGADSLTLYQETYHRESYKKHHLFGMKRQFNHRLDALEAGAQAGFHRISIGALLGLHDWRYDALALGKHLTYLMAHYWKIMYSVSFPRITEMIGDYDVPYEVTTKNLVQLITAFRCVYPDLGINLSTRESATLRDHLMPLGITSMSAESSTAPGGYSESSATEQFSTTDKRSLEDITLALKKNQLEPVFKDWDVAFNHHPSIV